MRRILLPFHSAELAAARVAAAAALRGGAGEVIALAADAARVPFGAFPNQVRVVMPGDIGIELERVAITAAAHGAAATARAIVPEAVAALAEDGDVTVVLRPSVRVVGPLLSLWAALEEHDAVLLPTLLEPSYQKVPDRRMGLERRPPSSPTDVLHSPLGAISSSLLAVRGRAGNAILDGWLGRVGVVSHYDGVDEARFGTWVDALAALPEVHVLRDPGVGVAWFNLHERPATESDGTVLAGGSPLSVLDLAGHDPRRPNVLCPANSIGFLSEHPALIPEVQAHSAELAAAGAIDPEPEGALANHKFSQGRWAELPNGDQMVAPMRNLYRSMMADGELTRSPFEQQGLNEMIEAFRTPGPRGRPAGVNRFVWSLWVDRAELRDSYPALEGPDGPGLVGWVWAYGREQELIPESVLPDDSERFARGDVGFTDPALAPESSRLASHRGGQIDGVNVAGFFSTQLGLGESVRQLVHSLRASEIDVTAVQGRVMPSGRGEAVFDYVTPDRAEHPVSILMLNGDSITAFADDVGDDFFRDRYTIGFYWWEVDPYPADAWDPALEYVDELWAGTEFVGDILRRGVDVPVTVIRVPVAEPPPVSVDRAHFGLPEDATLFAFVYDYESSGRRKNPLDLVNAYTAAFGPDDGAHLVLKSLGSIHRVEDHEEVLVAASGRDDISIIDRFLTAEEKDSLVGLCDCYVSPHRSEGFGYTIAEAMAYGKAVVCTGYGGVMDFVDESTARLVRWTPSITGPFAIPYPPDSRWADPDVEDLTRQLRWVHENPEEAAAMGRRAAARIRETHSYAVSGASMKARLGEIYADINGRNAEAAPAEKPLKPARTARREAFELAARLPVSGSVARRVRGSWQSIMDRAVGSRTRPAFAAVREEVAGVADVQRDLETVAERESMLAREQGDRLRRLEDELGRVGAGVETNRVALDGTQAQIAQTGRRADDEAAAREHLAEELASHREQHAPVPYGVVESGMRMKESPYGRALHAGFAGEANQTYGGFLGRFRGDWDRVRVLAEPYGPLLDEQGPVLDLGCGRGELLDVLVAAGTEARGVDLAPELVEEATSRGLNAKLEDALDAVASAADGELGAITALHVVEHLDIGRLAELLSECLRTLRPGGLLVIETVNTYNLPGAATFWLDPTHRRPVMPESLLGMAGDAGFAEGWIFAPDGSGDWDVDRSACSRYTLVARSA